MSNFLRGCALLFIVFGLASGCINDDANKKEKEIVWQDEFDGSGSLNSDYWSYDIGTGVEIFGRPGWGNNELQYYTDRPENVRINDGFLEITAREESFEGSDYTSARILTRGKFEKTFGRFEARIKLPFGQGIWPAFWLLGDDSNGTVNWPQIGEIDIMEYRGQEPTIVHGSVHGPGYSAGEAVTDSYVLSNSRFDTDFHFFAIEWGPDFIKYYVDDELYNEINPGDVNGEWVFNDNTFYIILNVAVGGSFVGSPNSRTPFPQTMVVDYVRVYAE
ncbi:glycoside hydrolase family 16 protein [Gracilimonas sediminicola]|uniref:Glycoside hydrolase family 16 protein n=1 Tax=Gracilimonas sediminicola TaxID=2952158 RepID=A0A9X2L5Y0_9BACT|nr:glycoside hydrolase family 16 protein [Gracilimonas sediminicola]MCP9292973.1 glycoside hydrolase family 16 protein [Gracilimonas sediminicola]